MINKEWIDEDAHLKEEGYDQKFINKHNGKELETSLNIEFNKIKISKKDINKYFCNSSDEEDVEELETIDELENNQ